jgi:hypothetical protein
VCCFFVDIDSCQLTHLNPEWSYADVQVVALPTDGKPRDGWLNMHLLYKPEIKTNTGHFYKNELEKPECINALKLP